MVVFGPGRGQHPRHHSRLSRIYKSSSAASRLKRTRAGYRHIPGFSTNSTSPSLISRLMKLLARQSSSHEPLNLICYSATSLAQARCSSTADDRPAAACVLIADAEEKSLRCSRAEHTCL